MPGTCRRLVCANVLALLLYTCGGQTYADPSAECPDILRSQGRRNSKERGGYDRIVDGVLPSKGLEKSMVSITDESGQVMCSGSILSEYWVLTSAWCPVHPGGNIVRAGGLLSSDGQELNISEIIQHPYYYSEKNYMHDVKLIRLASPVPESSKYVRLNTEASLPADFAFVRAAGYGMTFGAAEEGRLLQVDVPVQPIAKCQQQLEFFDVQESLHLCAGYGGGGCNVCFGDVGGPLFMFDSSENIVQVGISSFGEGCAEAQSPAGFIRVSSYINWFQELNVTYMSSDDGQNVFEKPATPPPIPPASGSGSAESASTEAGSTESGPTESAEASESDESDGASGSADGDSPQENECFPGTSEVALEGGRMLQMDALKVGDRVQVGVNEFSEVFMFTHRERTSEYSFVYLHTSSVNLTLAVSRGHFVYVSGELKAASDCRVGDVLHLGNGGTAMIDLITYGKARGLYNPQTLDGKIVVNGIVASTYTTAVAPETAHSLLSPVRYVFNTLGMLATGRTMQKSAGGG